MLGMIRSILKSGNACYYSMQNISSSSLLSKNKIIKIYRNIILTVVLYGCETWSLILREERRLRVFENRVLRRLFGPTRDEITGQLRKLHTDELNALHSSTNIICGIKSRRMRGARHVARMGDRRGAYRVSTGKREGEGTLGRSRRRSEDNIKLDLQEVGRGAWTGLIWLRIRIGGGLLCTR